MNRNRSLLQMSNLLLTMLLIVSCSTPTPPPAPVPPTAAPSPADKTTTTQIVRDAGKVAPAVAKDEKTEEVKDSEDGKIRYIYETHNVVENIDSITYLGLNDDIIWPGNLVRGDKANSFVYEPIAVKRAPITLSISLESSTSTGPSISHQVDDPKLSTVRQGISDLLKKAVTDKTKIPAKVEFSHNRVYNESQMKLFLGTDVKYGAGKLNANFNWDSAAKKTKILARYRQIYYSVDVDIPLNPAGFMVPSMTEDELRAAMPPGSSPMYIAGVSYGMMALVFIETDASEENIKAALDAAYSGGAEVKINGEFTSKQILENSSIKIIVYGGSTAELKNLETGYAGFKKVIEASSDFGPQTPGVPLLYKFRHLADSTLALTSLTSQYTITKPIKLVQDVRVTLLGIKCLDNNDGFPWGLNKFKIIKVGYNAYNAKDNHTFEVVDQSGKMMITLGGALGDAIKIYEKSDEWRPKKYDSLDVGKLSFPVRFETDPKGYDYKFAYIVFKGYALTDWAWGKNNVYGENTVYFSDFLSDGGEHTLTLNGSDGVLEIKFKIELVE